MLNQDIPYFENSVDTDQLASKKLADNIAPDKDWKQLGIYPPLLNWLFQVFVLDIYLKANK